VTRTASAAHLKRCRCEFPGRPQFRNIILSKLNYLVRALNMANAIKLPPLCIPYSPSTYGIVRVGVLRHQLALINNARLITNSMGWINISLILRSFDDAQFAGAGIFLLCLVSIERILWGHKKF
jgi:hypothetical protein